MTERFRGPKTPFSVDLRSHGLKKVDVKVFSQMYDMSDSEAAQHLISGSLRGFKIKFNQLYTERTRREAATKTFTEVVGEATHRQHSFIKKGQKAVKKI